MNAMLVTRVADARAARVARPRGAKTARLTVLFADLRGYTGLAERLAPARIVPLLDEFFRVLAGATTLHRGQVFHMAGDGMMAGFGLDDRAGGDGAGAGARDALAAGHAMLMNFAQVAERWRRELAIESGIGVGLHLGEVAMGMLGPPGRRRTTLVGDTVNVAARLCGRARAGELLLSSAVAAALDAGAPGGRDAKSIPVLQLPQFELRGRSEPLDIWCIPASERLAF
jgi:adenylate cyclase